MSQRDVNAEGLEKSFAINVLGQSSVRDEDNLAGKKKMGGVTELFCLFVLTRNLHSHQESHSLAGEERRPQSGEFVPHRQKLLSLFHII